VEYYRTRVYQRHALCNCGEKVGHITGEYLACRPAERGRPRLIIEYSVSLPILFSRYLTVFPKPFELLITLTGNYDSSRESYKYLNLLIFMTTCISIGMVKLLITVIWSEFW